MSEYGCGPIPFLSIGAGRTETKSLSVLSCRESRTWTEALHEVAIRVRFFSGMQTGVVKKSKTKNGEVTQPFRFRRRSRAEKKVSTVGKCRKRKNDGFRAVKRSVRIGCCIRMGIPILTNTLCRSFENCSLVADPRYGNRNVVS